MVNLLSPYLKNMKDIGVNQQVNPKSGDRAIRLCPYAVVTDHICPSDIKVRQYLILQDTASH